MLIPTLRTYEHKCYNLMAVYFFVCSEFVNFGDLPTNLIVISCPVIENFLNALQLTLEVVFLSPNHFSYI